MFPAVCLEIVKKYKPFLDELDLTYTQYITMMVMWERRQLSVKELGECLFLDSGTLTPLLKKLEQKGWVTRKRAHKDERVLIVTLTEEGEQLQKRAITIPEKMSRCVNNLTPEESDELYRLLYKLLGCGCPRNDNSSNHFEAFTRALHSLQNDYCAIPACMI